MGASFTYTHWRVAGNTHYSFGAVELRYQNAASQMVTVPGSAFVWDRSVGGLQSAAFSTPITARVWQVYITTHTNSNYQARFQLYLTEVQFGAAAGGRRLKSAEMETADVGYPELCSTLPFLQELILSDNAIGGGLPGVFADDSSCLPQLRDLRVERNQLQGALPLWMIARAEKGYKPRDDGFDEGLRTLHLGDNFFDDPRGEAAKRRMTRLRRACDRLGVDCTGLPPIDCTAFGPRYALSVKGDLCVKCPSEAERIVIALILAFAVALLLALVLLFAKLVRKYRTRVRHSTGLGSNPSAAPVLLLCLSPFLQQPPAVRQ